MSLSPYPYFVRSCAPGPVEWCPPAVTSTLITNDRLGFCVILTFAYVTVCHTAKSRPVMSHSLEALRRIRRHMRSTRWAWNSSRPASGCTSNHTGCSTATRSRQRTWMTASEGPNMESTRRGGQRKSVSVGGNLWHSSGTRRTPKNPGSSTGAVQLHRAAGV